MLLDGQHRLWAVVESATPIETYIIRDLPDDVFDTIDTGTPRQARDSLAVNGFKNTTVLSVAARFKHIHDTYGSIEHYGKGKGKAIINKEILAVVQASPDLQESVAFIAGSKSIKTFLSPAMASFLHCQFKKFDSSQADFFISKLANGDGLELQHPILVARNRLAVIKSGTDKGRVECAAVAIKAWNLFRSGKTAKAIRWPNVAGEEFPKIK